MSVVKRNIAKGCGYTTIIVVVFLILLVIFVPKTPKPTDTIPEKNIVKKQEIETKKDLVELYQQDAGNGITILKAQAGYSDLGIFTLHGEVQNNSSSTASSLKVTAQCYDASGQSITIQSVNSQPDTMPAGGVAAFNIFLPNATTNQISKCNLTTEASTASAQEQAPQNQNQALNQLQQSVQQNIQANELSPVEPEPQTTSSGGELTVIEHKLISEKYGRYIVGTAKNNSSIKYDYVNVQFNLYDKSGALVDNAIDGVDYLEPGATWKFRAWVSDDAVTTYRLEKVTKREY